MIEKVFTISLAIIGIWTLYRPDHIFGSLAIKIKRLFPKVTRPAFDCMVCMVPWYGFPMYFVLWPHPDFWVVLEWYLHRPYFLLDFFIQAFAEPAIVIIGAMGANRVIWYLVDITNALTMLIEYEQYKGNS